MSKRVNYLDQLRKRADRAAALEREVAELRARVAELSAVYDAYRFLYPERTREDQDAAAEKGDA
jgi:hypothetical protein